MNDSKQKEKLHEFPLSSFNNIVTHHFTSGRYQKLVAEAAIGDNGRTLNIVVTFVIVIVIVCCCDLR